MSSAHSFHKTELGSERNFAIVFCVVFLPIGLWPVFSGNGPRLWALVVALFFLAAGFLAPSLLRPLNLAWFKFGLLLGKVISPIVIAIIFFVAVTPTGVIMRLLRKDILNLKFNDDVESYWIERSKTINPMGSMKKQF